MEKAILWLLRSHSISIKYTDYWIACFINDLIFFEIQHSVPFLKVTVDGLYLKGWNTKSLLPNISLCYSVYVSTSATLFFESLNLPSCLQGLQSFQYLPSQESCLAIGRSMNQQSKVYSVLCQLPSVCCSRNQG